MGEAAKKRNLVFIAIMLGMVSSVLMQTVIATVLPIITNDLGQPELYGWTFSSYMIASIVTIPLFANLSDMYGRKNFYQWGMIFFLVGSLLCGFSQSMVQLIIFRVIQGIGAGAIAPSAIAMVSEVFEPAKRGKMLGLLASAQVFASIIGPLLGGMITDLYSWQWTFFINIPIGCLAFLLIHRNYFDIQKNLTCTRREMDYFGSVALGSFLILTIFFFQLQENSLYSLKSMIILILAVIIFIVFLIHEKKHVNPIPSLNLIRIKNVKYSFIGMFLLGIISYGMITILPIYGQGIFGGSALSSGRMLVIFSLGIGIGSFLSGILSKYLNDSKLIPISWFITFLGLLLLIIAQVSNVSFYHQFSYVFLVGGKGANLGELLANQFSVPDGFCVSVDAYKNFISQNKLQAEINQIIAKIQWNDPTDIEHQSAKIRDLILEKSISSEIEEEILKAYHQMENVQKGKGYVAVRSSATAEDLPDASFAGQQETFLYVKGEKEILHYIKGCWASLWSGRAMAYRNKKEYDHNHVFISVVVQEMVDATVSGIMFTVNPLSQKKMKYMLPLHLV